jgi:hypothetical protein
MIFLNVLIHLQESASCRGSTAPQPPSEQAQQPPSGQAQQSPSGQAQVM